MTLKRQPIDLFLHPTGVRPGSVLEIGDTFSLAGAVGPPLPALVTYTVTRPGGQALTLGGRANRVGYYHEAAHDFVVDQPGIWTVDVHVTFDGQTSAGQVQAPFPTGGVLGAAEGRFHIYVVPRDSATLEPSLPREASVASPGALDVVAATPDGAAPAQAHFTAVMPGFLLESGNLAPGAVLTYAFDPVRLAGEFPNLDARPFWPPAADLVTISLYAGGAPGDEAASHAARVVALHATRLLNLPAPSLPPFLDATVDRSTYRPGQALTLSVHHSQATIAEPLDAYIGLVRPGGDFESLQIQGDRFALVPTGFSVLPVVQGALPALEFSGPLVQRLFTPQDPPGVWLAGALLVRAGQSPFDQSHWVGLRMVQFTLGP
jgi:hypothetical protein